MTNPVLLSYVENDMVFEFPQTNNGMVGGSGDTLSPENDTNPDDNKSIVNHLQKAWTASETSLKIAYGYLGTGAVRAGDELVGLGTEAASQVSNIKKTLSIDKKQETQPDIEAQISRICSEYKKREREVDELLDKAFVQFKNDIDANVEDSELEKIKSELKRECARQQARKTL